MFSAAARLRQGPPTFLAIADPGRDNHCLGDCPAPAALPRLVDKTGGSWKQGERLRPCLILKTISFSRGTQKPGEKRQSLLLEHRKTHEATRKRCLLFLYLVALPFTPIFPLECELKTGVVCMSTLEGAKPPQKCAEATCKQVPLLALPLDSLAKEVADISV